MTTSVSEAGGAGPLPTGAVETGENSSPAAAGSFFEALAAQTDAEGWVPGFGFPLNRPPPAEGDSDGEDSEVDPESSDTAGGELEAPATDISPLHDGNANSLLTALVGASVDPATPGLPEEATTDGGRGSLPAVVYRSSETVVPAPTSGNNVELRGLGSETQAAPNRVRTSVDPAGPAGNQLPHGVSRGPVPLMSAEAAPTVSGEATPLVGGEATPPTSAETAPLKDTLLDQQTSLTGTTLQTSSAGLKESIDAAPAPPTPPGVSSPSEEEVKLPVADTKVVRGPSHPTRQITESSVKTPMNAAVDPGSGRDVPEAPSRPVGITSVQPSDPMTPTAVAPPPELVVLQKVDASVRQAHIADPLTAGEGQRAPSLATAFIAARDTEPPDTALDEKTELGRFLGRAEVPVKARTQPSVMPVGTRQTLPIMVDPPADDGVSTHPVWSLPGSNGTDAAVAQQVSVSVSVGIGATEAWRYEEVARLLEDSGHVAQRSRASATASAVAPLDALPDWTGAAVRSSFSPPALSDLEALELPDQLVRGIRMQWRNGGGEAKLRLTPEHLGEVLVSLHVRQGSVSAVLRADSEMVRDWIRAHQHELKASLEAQGLQLDELVVEEDGRADREPAREFDRPRRRPIRQTSEARFEVRV